MIRDVCAVLFQPLLEAHSLYASKWGGDSQWRVLGLVLDTA